VLALLALLAVAGGPTFAQEASAPPTAKSPTALEVGFQPSKGMDLPHYLTARLTAEDGSAVAGERVTFRRQADIFGGRSVELARAMTDNAGVARVPVVPREPTYELDVSFAGSAAFAASSVTNVVTFPEGTVVRTARPPHGGGLVDPQLSPLADVMPGVIGTAVLVIWVVLLTIGLGTVRKIRVEARKGEGHSSDDRVQTPGSRPENT
jgi:hypothetical protein